MNFGYKSGRILKILSTLVLLLSLPGFAAEPIKSMPKENLAVAQAKIPLAATNANWIFSGSVSTENGESYEYFFQTKRNLAAVEATVSLVDAQSKAVIFMESSRIQLTDPTTEHWVIGDIFLSYNSINHSWIFGLKKANQLGFNFKVDTLKQPEFSPQTKQLQKGVMMTILQTGQVNGHILFKENEAAQFVSGKNAWFREVIMDEVSVKLPAMNGLMCHFDDGSGIYSMQILDKTIKHSHYTGSYDARGLAAAVSKTIQVNHLNSGLWRVNVLHPKFQFDLADVLNNQPMVMGFVNQKQKSGFCVISKEDTLG